MSARRILVTGSHGLVGTALVKRLREVGHAPTGIDLREGNEQFRGDVREPAHLSRALDEVDGVVHLAAVSRVVWAERDPTTCSTTNVDALRLLLRLAFDAPRRPWVVFVSSREVYGQPLLLPANESSPLAPVNVYGRSKVAGEMMCIEAAHAGLRVAIVRLSNVYGSVRDHADRVVPAFVRAALAGEPLRIEGADNTFDFVHVDDAVSGLVAVVDALHNRGVLPPLHLLTGVPTTLSELARLAVQVSSSRSSVVEAPSRTFDVARFFGYSARARATLGWEARISVQAGVARLIAETRAHRAQFAVSARLP